MQPLVAGFGSIGKKHVNNLLARGLNPLVYTKYPDRAIDNVKFVSSLNELKELTYQPKWALICNNTSLHYKTIKELNKIGISHFLVEKPVTSTLEQAYELKKIQEEKGLTIRVAYNMRFLKCFDIITKFIEENSNEIYFIEIVAGQHLPEWRPYKEYRDSYSAWRHLGGGVDLDLSHEIDYMLWLFGTPATKNIQCLKVSSLEGDSPDVFAGHFVYEKKKKSFFVNLTLDYLRRPKERYIKIHAEKAMMNCDFARKKLEIIRYVSGETITINHEELFSMESTYLEEIDAFLDMLNNNHSEKRGKLCTLEEAIKVLETIDGSRR